MIYQVVSPFVTTIDGNSFQEAIKRLVKLKRDVSLTDIIIKDQQNHWKAQVKYYMQDGRNKVGINMFPINYSQPMPLVINDTYIPPLSQISPFPLSPVSPFPLSPVPFIPTVVHIPHF